MKRSVRLQPVVDIAEREQESRSREYSLRVQHGDVARDKLQQLVSYRDEYAQTQQQRHGACIDLARLQESRVFMTRLADAIRLQETEVRRLDALALAARSDWLASRRRSLSLDGLVSNYRQEERVLADKRDQNRADELSGQRHAWQARSQGGTT